MNVVDNGDAVTIFSGLPLEGDPVGWTIIDTILVRFGVSDVPSGHFPVSTNKLYLMGCDAAVCVQKYEPWIIEASNKSTVSPSVLRIVGRGDSSTALPPSGTIRGAPLANVRYLNATGKVLPFLIGHENGVGQMMSDNGRGFQSYFPFPAVGFPCIPRVQHLC